MKLNVSTVLVATSLAGTSAFAPSQSLSTKATRVFMSESAMEPPSTEEEVVEAPVTPPLPKMSQALPFMERPAALDGSLVGDVGFDPLGFAKTKDDLMNYREAEIKHARLAMLVSY